jgi:prephenate dehydrogenase
MKPLKKITIIGVGFMGGSLALALLKAYPNIFICGYARNKASLLKLSRLKFLDCIEEDLERAVKDSDIIILSLPIYAIISHLEKIAPFLKKGAIVFDMGSSKELIERAAHKYLPKDVNFVGCHPLCGSEKSGARFAQGNLYKGALCVITSPRHHTATKIVKCLWQKLGCKVIFMPSKEHDRVLSLVSHLNHVISFCITQNLKKECLSFILPSLKDLTRLSGSPASVWADIFISNKKNLSRDIKKFIKVLEKVEKMIAGAKINALARFIEKVNQKQALLN